MTSTIRQFVDHKKIQITGERRLSEGRAVFNFPVEKLICELVMMHNLFANNYFDFVDFEALGVSRLACHRFPGFLSWLVFILLLEFCLVFTTRF